VTRVGIGYDVHRFAEARPLILGGVVIPSTAGLEGHSDADVLLHAIMDALLGAAGLGDIGVHFPPSDEQWRGSSSVDLLRIVGGLLPAGWLIENIDCSVIAEHPRIGPYREAMVTCIASTLGISPSQVNVKATTNEGLGFIGRGEGVAALACVALAEPGDGA
jgi:2-C-methyl-D-erythritol 2,4-cyclodiphosphate synthase